MKILILITLLISSTLYSNPPKETKWVGYQAKGEEYYNPVDFFNSRHPDFPELEGVHSGRMKINGVMADYLEDVGVPVLIGNQGEFGGFFDLYSPTITRSQFLNEVPIGPNKNGGVGNLYLMQHDLAHHFAGIPGIRYSDLENPEKTRQLIIDILLDKEVFATSISSAYYIPGYMEWREKPGYAKYTEFRKYAQGYYSGLEPMTKSEHVDVLTYFIKGKTGKYVKFLREKLTKESLQRTKDLGVPRAIPDLSGLVGDKIDSALMSFVATYVEPIHSRYRKIGHVNFVKYSEALADMMMTDWYVKWSEDFKIGIPLDELHKRTLNIIDQVRKDQKLVNPDIGNIYHLKGWKENMLKQEMALFGRRMNEVFQMAGDKDTSDLKKVYDNVVKTYDQLLAGGSYEEVATKYKSYLHILETQFPLDKYIPWSIRPAGASSKNFWRNPYGIVFNRGEDLKNANAPRLSPKFLQGQYYGKREFAKDRVGSLQRALYDSYDQHLEDLKHSVKVRRGSDQNRYIQSIVVFLEESLLPQFPYLYVDRENKILIEKSIQNLLTRLKKMDRKAIDIPVENNRFYVAAENMIEEIYEFAHYHKRKKGNIFTQKDPLKVIEKIIALENIIETNGYKSSSPLKIQDFLYTSPPIEGYKVGEIADIVRDSELKKAYPVEYSSMADWINTNRIHACNRYLKK